MMTEAITLLLYVLPLKLFPEIKELTYKNSTDSYCILIFLNFSSKTVCLRSTNDPFYLI